MTNDNEYLQKVLKSQSLADDSPEMKQLRERRQHVENVLCAAFPKSSPTIRYGGSKAKRTLIKELYDLDLVCYFPNSDTNAGETLENIYHNVSAALAKHYQVMPKRSALRLRDIKTSVDFHIDVVPGRFTDDENTDCFLWQNEGEKKRLKTNLDVHIVHVRDSGVVDAIRVLKLWKTRKALPVKQFAFELLIIELLAGSKNKSLPAQVKKVWAELRDRTEPVAIEDPANPSGNDLSDLLGGSVWWQLSSVARSTLESLDANGWEAIFGKVEEKQASAAPLKSAVGGVAVTSRPWAK